ncbi:MAG: hypothetical protein ACP5JG_03440 [Anaerolineae bacterium]
MADQILLYISAAADLDLEREVLGRAVTEVPVDISWRVVLSPPGNGQVEREALRSADVHVLVMGGDIRAPIGLEWQVAREAGRQPVTLLKDGILRTPAGQRFVRMVRADAGWAPFHDAAELRQKVLMVLADHILANAVRYVLSPEELSRLQRWHERLTGSTASVDEETRGGAGESSVHLSRERFTPSGGVLIEPSEEAEG